MAISYGFFNSINGDRTYDADDISNYFLKLISNGVFATPSNAMQVQSSEGMTVQVSAGWGFIDCKWINNDAPYYLTLDASTMVMDRIDRVVLRLNMTNEGRNIEIAVKKGQAATTPQPPALTRSAGAVWELSLAQIYIAAGVESITQANITDERADTSVCGYVTGLIDQIDTTGLFAQYDYTFNTWFDLIKDEVKTTSIVVQYGRVYYTTEADEQTIPIGISQYNSALDILNVYVDGLKVMPGADYTVNNGNVIFRTPLHTIDTTVSFEVLKSMNIGSAETIVAKVLELEQKVEALTSALGGMSFVQCTLDEYNTMTTHSTTTIYTTIDNSGNVVQYLGDVKLQSGSGAPIGQATGLLNGLTNSTIGQAEEVTE